MNCNSSILNMIKRNGIRRGLNPLARALSPTEVGSARQPESCRGDERTNRLASAIQISQSHLIRQQFLRKLTQILKHPYLRIIEKHERRSEQQNPCECCWNIPCLKITFRHSVAYTLLIAPPPREFAFDSLSLSLVIRL